MLRKHERERLQHHQKFKFSPNSLLHHQNCISFHILHSTEWETATPPRTRHKATAAAAATQCKWSRNQKNEVRWKVWMQWENESDKSQWWCFWWGRTWKRTAKTLMRRKKRKLEKVFFFTTTGKFPISSLTFPLLCCCRRSIRRAAKGEFSSFHQVFVFHYHTFFNFSDSLAYGLLFSFALSLCLVFQLSCNSNQSGLLVVPGSINFPVRAFARWFATTTMQLSTMYHLQNSSWNYFVGKELFRSFHRFARLSRSSDCWTWCDLNFSWWNSD